MKKLFVMLFLIGFAHAHEMVPTYPTWGSTYIEGVSKTTMEMFNKRQDVEYYEIGVFDKDFNPIPFVSQYTVLKLKYLGHVIFDVYIKNEDVERATYICSQSKIRKDEQVRTAISSKICSKFR
jgi:hypothetical protein